MNTTPPHRGSAPAMWRAMRPNQWTKNTVVLAAFLFAFWDRTQPRLESAVALRAVGAMLLFCLASSSIYLLNDIADIEADRQHPTKQRRPIAAGLVSRQAAWALSLALMCAACIGAWRLSAPFALALIAYLLLQLVYNVGLKRVALVDILVIASGFVLRAIAGAVVIDVIISPWLLLCTFLLALFLALCKRRHEKARAETGDGPGSSRPALAQYTEQLLDQLIAIVSAATVVCYAIYTLAPDTVAKFGSSRLGFTIPFVMFGIFRYLDLVYRHDKGERPEKILLTDPPILVDLLLYGMAVVAALTLGS